MLGLLPVGLEAKLLFNLLLGLLLVVLDERELIHRLGIVGHGAITVDCDGHRTHAQHTERHQTKSEDGGKFSILAKQGADAELLGSEVGQQHQAEEHQASPETAEVTRDETAEDVQRRTALTRGVHHLIHMGRCGRCE